MHAAVQHGAERVDDVMAHAGKAFGERVGAQQNHGAGDLLSQRLANSHSVGAHKVELQLPDIRRRDAHVAELSHAGVYRVGHLVAIEQVFDHRPRAIDCLPSFGLKQHRAVFVNHLAHCCERQTVAVDVKGFQRKILTVFTTEYTGATLNRAMPL